MTQQINATRLLVSKAEAFYSSHWASLIRRILTIGDRRRKHTIKLREETVLLGLPSMVVNVPYGYNDVFHGSD